MHPGTTRSERGQALSSFLVVVVVALLLVTGLVVDGGRKSAADRRAELDRRGGGPLAVDTTGCRNVRPDAVPMVVQRSPPPSG